MQDKGVVQGLGEIKVTQTPKQALKDLQRRFNVGLEAAETATKKGQRLLEEEQALKKKLEARQAELTEHAKQEQKLWAEARAAAKEMASFHLPTTEPEEDDPKQEPSTATESQNKKDKKDKPEPTREEKQLWTHIQATMRDMVQNAGSMDALAQTPPEKLYKDINGVFAQLVAAQAAQAVAAGQPTFWNMGGPPCEAQPPADPQPGQDHELVLEEANASASARASASASASRQQPRGGASGEQRGQRERREQPHGCGCQCERQWTNGAAAAAQHALQEGTQSVTYLSFAHRLAATELATEALRPELASASDIAEGRQPAVRNGHAAALP